MLSKVRDCRRRITLGKMADDAKSFLGLLNGLARRTYYGDAELSNDFLQSELYPGLSEKDFSDVLAKCMSILKSLASADMDFNQLEAYLTSQTRKKEGGITEEQAKIITKFWKSHKSRVHEAIVANSTWGNTLKDFSWRIDIKTQAKHIDQINTPTAIVELQIEENTSKIKETEVIRFEMDEEKLGKVLSNLQEIEEEIEQHCK